MFLISQDAALREYHGNGKRQNRVYLHISLEIRLRCSMWFTHMHWMSAELHFSQGDIGACLTKFDTTDKCFHVREIYTSHHLVKLSEGKLQHIPSQVMRWLGVIKSHKVTLQQCATHTI